MRLYALTAVSLLGLKSGVTGYNSQYPPPPCNAERKGFCYYAGNPTSFHLAFECNDKQQWIQIPDIHMSWEEYRNKMNACKWVNPRDDLVFSADDLSRESLHDYRMDSDSDAEYPIAPNTKRDWNIACDNGSCWYTQDTVTARSTPTGERREHLPPGYHPLDVILDKSTGELGFVNHIGKRVHPRGPNYYTRCKSGHSDIVEILKGGKWHDYHKCEKGGVCMDVEGHGSCVWQHDYVAFIGPSGFLDAHEERNAFDESHVFPFEVHCDPAGSDSRCVFIDDGLPVDFKGKPEYDTRCAPNEDSIVERFNGQEWEVHHVCERGGKCFDVSGQGSCVWQHDGKSKVWMQFGPHNHLQLAHSKSQVENRVKEKKHANDKAVRIDSRCTPGGFNSIEKFNGTDWNRVINCPIPDGCVDLGGFAACWLGGTTYYVPGAQHLHIPPIPKRTFEQAPPPREPDLHSFDTRCNPKNLNEIQRFNGREWVLHWTCPVEGSCKDVNGIGACWIGQTHYILPAANSSTDTSKPLDPAKIHIHKRCKNEKVVEMFTHTGWKEHTQCPEPFVCEDFQDAGIAVCVLPNAAVNKAVFMPQPPVDEKDDLGLRCLNERSVLQAIDNHDGTFHHIKFDCPDNFRCYASQKSGRAACMAPDLTYLNEYRHYLRARSLDKPPNDFSHIVRDLDFYSDSDDEDGFLEAWVSDVYDSPSYISDSESSDEIDSKDPNDSEASSTTSMAIGDMTSSHSILSDAHIDRGFPTETILPRFEGMHARRVKGPKRHNDENGESD
jgi:ferredoxin